MSAKIYQFPVSRRSANLDTVADDPADDLARAVADRPGWQLVDERHAAYGPVRGWTARIIEVDRDGRTRWFASIIRDGAARYACTCDTPAAAVAYAEQLPADG